MEAIAEIILVLIAALVELTVWAVIGLFVVVRAIFSQRHREKLKREWNSGWKGKIAIVFSAVLWTSIIATAGYFWVPALL